MLSAAKYYAGNLTMQVNDSLKKEERKTKFAFS